MSQSKHVTASTQGAHTECISLFVNYHTIQLDHVLRGFPYTIRVLPNAKEEEEMDRNT